MRALSRDTALKLLIGGKLTEKYGRRMADKCGKCIAPDPCYRIDDLGK
jgi:hypothetical protein